MRRAAKPKWGKLKSARPMAGGYYSNPHQHGCDLCRYTIPICRCETPEQDPLCSLCAFGRDRPFWPHAWLPSACCVTDSTPVQSAVVVELLLAGPGPWFRCSTCGLCFAFDPARETPPLDPQEWQERFGDLPRTPATAEEWAEAIRRYG